MKKIILAFIILSSFFVNVFAQQANVVTEGPGFLPANNACPIFTLTLSRGMTDSRTSGQVSQLQNFLKQNLGLTDQNFIVTGNFGILTKKFVMQFQQKNNIKMTGSVGPLTRAKIISYCNTTNKPNPTNSNFTANPISGSAPLTVTFSSMYGGDTYLGQPTLDFGDGKTEKVASCFAPTDACSKPGINIHTYQNTGTYTAKIVRNYCPPNADCLVAEQILGTQTITVQNSILNNSEQKVSATLDKNIVNIGGTLNINWNSQNIPSDWHVVLELRHEYNYSGQTMYTQTDVNQAIKEFSYDKKYPLNGSLQITLPTVFYKNTCEDAYCPDTKSTPVPAGKYSIAVTALPSNYCGGGFVPCQVGTSNKRVDADQQIFEMK